MVQRSHLILVIAAVLDFAIGDPSHWLHPVQVMGWLISGYVAQVLQILKRPLALRLAGVVLAIGLIGGSGLVGWLLAVAATRLQDWLGVAVESVILASCFAGRSLRNAAQDVLMALETEDLPTARQRLSQYVGRDTANLDQAEILRAILETVTENAIDGVLAPLFYALLGSWLFPGGGVALALAYKATSTLDSMVGYRTAPYTDLGWFSAKTDDVLTWLPCRLAVVTLGLLSGRPLQVWRICLRDAPQDPSPNSGWSESVYAAILRVQIGGVNYYQGVTRSKPLMGDPIRPITPDHLNQATALTRSCFLLWLGGTIAGSIVAG